MSAPSTPASRSAVGVHIATVVIGLVWGINGLWAKILGQVPRHAEIVARVVGDAFAGPLTVVIGVAELVMLAWFLSGRHTRLCAAAQVAIVLTMNVIEQVIAADLLLFGRFNLLLACLFCGVVIVRERAVRDRA